MAVLAGIALGANIGSTLLGLGAEKARAERMEAAFLREAVKQERINAASQFSGFTQSEGNLADAVTSRTLSSLANRGILQSSISPGAVARAVAPIEERRQRRIERQRERAQNLRLGAATAGASAPGFGDFLGGALGEVGGFLALKAGQQSVTGTPGTDLFGELKNDPTARLTDLGRFRVGPDEAFLELGAPPQ